MTRELHNLLTSDLFTDAPEYAERVARIKQLTEHTTFADSDLTAEARVLYENDDLEIDPEPPTSVSENGTWVAAWVWVSKEAL